MECYIICIPYRVVVDWATFWAAQLSYKISTGILTSFSPFSWATTSTHTVFVWCLVNYCLFFNKLHHQICQSQAKVTALSVWTKITSYDAILVWSTVYLHEAWIGPTVLKWPLYDLHIPTFHPRYLHTLSETWLCDTCVVGQGDRLICPIY